MLQFNEFTKMIESNIVDTLGDDYKGCRAEIKRVDKVNTTRVGITLKSSSDGARSARAIIYLEGFYDEYMIHSDIEKSLGELASVMKSAQCEQGHVIEEFPDFSSEEFMDCITIKLINAENNMEYLKDKPHKRILDLAIIYICTKELADKSRLSLTITNSILDTMEITHDQLYLHAHSNLIKPNNVHIGTLESIIMGELEFNIDNIENPKDVDLFVLTNKELHCGAAQLLDIRNLQRLSEIYETNLYIMPSSIHEVMITSSNWIEAFDLLMMVEDGNRTTDQQEILSNRIYMYDRDTNKIEIIM